MTKHHKDARDVLIEALERELHDGPTNEFRTDEGTALFADALLLALTEHDPPLLVGVADEPPPGYVREEDVAVYADADGRLHCSRLIEERNAAIEERDRERGMAHEADVHRERMRARLAEAHRERAEWAERAGEAMARVEAAERREAALLAEKQAVLDTINLYGDDVLHSALDDIGWVPRAAHAASPCTPPETHEGADA